jgi:transposase
MIGVHVFLCIIGMLFYRHLAWKLRKFKLSQRELREKLEGVRVSVIKSRYTKEVKFVVKEMNAQQARLFSALDLWTHMKF